MVAIEIPITQPQTATLSTSLLQPAQWHVITRSQKRKHSTVYIRTSPKGRISFSIAAYRALGSPRDIEILLDKPNARLGFRPATSEARSWHVSVAPSTAYVACARILKLLNLRSQPLVFPATVQGGTLIVSTRDQNLPDLFI